VALQVYPSASRPHYLKAAGVPAGVYVRVGSTNRRADDELVAEMRRASLGKPFDEQAMPELDSEAVDFRVASERIAPVRKLRRGDMETLRLLVPHQGRPVPFAGDILLSGLLGLLGRARARQLPVAWIRAGRVSGADKTTLVDSAALRGPCPRSSKPRSSSFRSMVRVTPVDPLGRWVKEDLAFFTVPRHNSAQSRRGSTHRT
jgi:predicted HTH transcriptional regulator